jgi:YVTN family beta-propeller protein
MNGALKIDTEKKKVVDWVQLAQSPKFPSDGKASHGPGVSPDGKYLYLTSQVLNSVSVVDIASEKIVHEIPVGIDPNWIGFSSEGKYAVVSNTASNDASIIDLATRKVVKTIPVGKSPKRLAVGKVITR